MILKHGGNPRARDRKTCRTPAGWAADAGHTATASRILDADIEIFDAIGFDRADRIADILDRDPGAIHRRFGDYATCEPAGDQPCRLQMQRPSHGRRSSRSQRLFGS